MATSTPQEDCVLLTPAPTVGPTPPGHSDDERQSQYLDLSNPKNKKRWRLLSGWWWEAGSLLLCIISIVLSATIFLYMDDKPLRAWRLPIQPNSLIAVFSTITKAALLYPLSECIGQLKWAYFRQPRRLSNMLAFDIASRGPWGATLFLWETNAIASPLASVGAAVTILLLGFEPFMQQVIVFESRLAPLHNVTAAISTAQSWPHGEIERFGSALAGDFDIPIASSIIAAATELDAHSPADLVDLNAYCPTSSCNYSSFDTLAICSSCETKKVDISDFDCEIDISWANCTTCVVPLEPLSSWEDARESIREKVYNSRSFALNATCKYNKTEDDEYPMRMKLRVAKSMKPNISSEGFNGTVEYEEFSIKPYGTGLGTSRLDEVTFMQQYRALYGGRTEAAVMYTSGEPILKEKYLSFCNSDYPSWGFDSLEKKVLDTYCFASTTDFEPWTDNSEKSIGRIGNITGSMTTCSLAFCAKRYDNVSIRDNQLWNAESTTMPLSQLSESNGDSIESNATQRFCVDGDPSCPYSWNRDALFELGRLIASGIGTYQFAMALNLPVSGPSTPDKFPRIMTRIAQGVSKVLQSELNPAARNVTGVAEGHEIFVRVRWAWVIFPLSVALVGVVFLLATVVRNMGEARLFKNSILAAFLFELDAWATAERRVDGRDGRQTGQDVLRVAQGMIGTISADDRADLKFKRE